MDRSGTSIVSDATWHEPFGLGHEIYTKYLKPIHLKDSAGKNENHDSLNLLAKTKPLGSDIMDYGLLHFTTQTLMLTLRLERESGRDPSATKGPTQDGSGAWTKQMIF